MQKSSIDINEYRKVFEDVVKKNQYRDYIDYGLKKENIKISLQNVDSRYRDTEPRNVLEENYSKLSTDPIETTTNSNRLKISFPGHTLQVGDFITISNVESYDQDLFNSLYLIYNFNYLLIYLPDHNITTDYKSYISNLYINITQTSNISELNNFTNIQKNMLVGKKEIYLLDDVLEDYIFIDNLITQIETLGIFTTVTQDIINQNFIFTKLDYSYVGDEIYTIPDIYNITLLNSSSIPINEINSNYPLSYERKQGYKEIKAIDTDYIYIDTDTTAYSNVTFGGSNIIISKIKKQIQGYTNPGNCTIELQKTYTNIIRIEMVSSEFPISNYIVTSGTNNKLYWKYYNTGDTEYSISLSSGNYSAQNIIDEITTKFNNVNEDITLEMEMDLESHTTTFNFYELVHLPNSLAIDYITIDERYYYLFTIKHPNNTVIKGDQITIYNAETSSGISSSTINTTHEVYSIDETNQTYTFLIPLLDESLFGQEVDERGGVDVMIKVPTKIQLLFNKNDTIGDIIGFNNVGDDFSITYFSNKITNKDDYMYQPNETNNNLINFNSNNLYWLLYINDYEGVINNQADNSFAKILLGGDNNDIVFNSVIRDAVEFDKPLPSLKSLDIKITDYKGNVIDFVNTEFSFTLRIYELNNIPVDSGYDSKDKSFIKTLIENNT